jgi:hypothetical protein
LDTTTWEIKQQKESFDQKIVHQPIQEIVRTICSQLATADPLAHAETGAQALLGALRLQVFLHLQGAMLNAKSSWDIMESWNVDQWISIDYSIC